MKRLLLLTTFITISSIAFSQGHFLKRGENGFGLMGEYIIQKDINTYAVGAGYSIEGRYDFSLSVSRSSYEYKSYWYNMHYRATGVGFLFEYHFFKPEIEKPSGMTLHAGSALSFSDYSGIGYPHDTEIDHQLMFGTDIYLGLRISDGLLFTPTMTFDFNWVTGHGGGTIFSFTPRGLFTIGITEKVKVVVGGGVTLIKGAEIGKLNLGLVL